MMRYLRLYALVLATLLGLLALVNGMVDPDSALLCDISRDEIEWEAHSD